MILDSTFLIDVLRGERAVEKLVEQLDTSGTPFVSAVTVMELYEGVHLADATESERAAVEQLLEDLTELPFDRECALQAGRINAQLLSNGEPVDETDVMIAATGLVNDQPIVTRNVEHFERIDGVTVVSY